jgi:hypothetical protein
MPLRHAWVKRAARRRILLLSLAVTRSFLGEDSGLPERYIFMPFICRCKLVQRLACLAIVTATALVAGSGSALAGYGPPPPPPAPVPGGYYCIVTSQTVGPAGKLIGPLRLDGLVAVLRVRRDTFPAPVQITITQPYMRTGVCQGGPGIGNAGFRGYRAVGGIGVLVQVNGVTYRQTFRKPLRLLLVSRSITRSGLVVVWNGRRFVIALDAVVGRGLARVGVLTNSDFAVLARVRHRRHRHARTAAQPAAAAAARTQDSSWELAMIFRGPAGLPSPGLGVVVPG